jgi:hypothetical protein
VHRRGSWPDRDEARLVRALLWSAVMRRASRTTERGMTNLRVTGAALVVMAAAAGCRCPDAYFAKDQPFDVTVLQASSTDNNCRLQMRPPVLAPGDTFVLLGTGDQSFEVGMCDDGTLVPDATPTFATDILTSCDPYNRCVGETAAGCKVTSQVFFTRTHPLPDTAGVFSISWYSACDLEFLCKESYDVSFGPVGH